MKDQGWLLGMKENVCWERERERERERCVPDNHIIKQVTKWEGKCPRSMWPLVLVDHGEKVSSVS